MRQSFRFPYFMGPLVTNSAFHFHIYSTDSVNRNVDLFSKVSTDELFDILFCNERCNCLTLVSALQQDNHKLGGLKKDKPWLTTD